MKKIVSITILLLICPALVFADSGFARGSGFNEGDLLMRKYAVGFQKVDATPPCPVDGEVKFYAKDGGSGTTLYKLDSGCNETEIGSGGGGGSGTVGSGTVSRIPVYTGTTTIASPYDLFADSNGNVGIGTALPQYTLDIGGNMQAASGNFSGFGQDFIQADTAQIDFKEGGPGVIRLAARNLEGENQQIDLDLSSQNDTIIIRSPTGATHTTWFGDFTLADKLVAPVIQAGSDGGGSSATWDVSSAVVASYLMEENAASTAVDNFEGTAALDGTASTNTANMSTTGKIDLGFSFNGSRTIDLGSDAALKITGDMAACTWVNTTGNNQNFGGNRANSTPFNGWRLGDNLAGGLFFLVDGDATSTASVNSGISINDGLWHFVCGVRTNGQGIVIYIDAIPAGNTVDTNSYDIGTGAANTKIGDIPLVSVSNGDPLVGTLDNFMIFDRAITQEEVTGLYNSGTGTNLFLGGSGGTTGASPGCFMVYDINGSTKTEIRTLNGKIIGHVDTNGICDGI